MADDTTTDDEEKMLRERVGHRKRQARWVKKFKRPLKVARFGKAAAVLISSESSESDHGPSIFAGGSSDFEFMDEAEEEEHQFEEASVAAEGTTIQQVYAHPVPEQRRRKKIKTDYLQPYVNGMCAIRAICGVSDSAVRRFHENMVNNLEFLWKAKQEGILPRRGFFIRKRGLRVCPPVSLDVIKTNDDGKHTVEMLGLTRLPKTIDMSTVNHVKAAVSVRELLKHYQSVHRLEELPSPVHVRLHSDGVPESKSGSYNLRVNCNKNKNVSQS